METASLLRRLSVEWTPDAALGDGQSQYLTLPSPTDIRWQLLIDPKLMTLPFAATVYRLC